MNKPGLLPAGRVQHDSAAQAGPLDRSTDEPAVIRSVRNRLAAAVAAKRALPRPAVTLSFAQSLDGCITACQGSSTPISSDQSMLMTHQLRAMHDAILVGINTVLVDDPRLTVRHAHGPDPIPVVLDSQLRIPPTARLLQHAGRQPIIATLPDASREREQRLVAAGAQVVRVPAAPHGGVWLADLFRWLHAQQIGSLMIEGGSRVICSVLSDALADQVVLTIAPKFFGKNGVRAAGSLNCVRSPATPRLANVAVEQLGDDLVVWGELAQDDPQAAGR
ncbi:MAG: RibD family protein [Pseudomonadota bacterium]